MSVALPELKWSDWFLWSERHEIENCTWPGVYRIAIGRRSRLDGLNGWDRVRYIGMSLVPENMERPSRRSGLAARWSQLDGAMKGKLAGHGAGTKMCSRYGPLEGDVFPRKHGANTVFVSAMPYAPRKGQPDYTGGESATQLREDGVVLYLEYEALAQYFEARKRNRRPMFNRK